MSLATLANRTYTPGATPAPSRVISLNITRQSYTHVKESILSAARQGRAGYACFANVHMVVEARQNPVIAQAVNGADWITADGVPLTWAIKGLYGEAQERIAGMDMLPDLLAGAERDGLPVFFYGSTPEMLERTVAVCDEKFPHLTVAGTFSPPFRPLTELEESAVAEQITLSGAKLVFVALGCPKQELWMARMRNRIPAVLLGIGGALPVFAGGQTRAPQWMQRAGLEWLYRMGQEPGRLMKRYGITNSLFVWHLIRQMAFGAETAVQTGQPLKG